jgi:hypothetical protein
MTKFDRVTSNPSILNGQPTIPALDDAALATATERSVRIRRLPIGIQL